MSPESDRRETYPDLAAYFSHLIGGLSAEDALHIVESSGEYNGTKAGPSEDEREDTFFILRYIPEAEEQEQCHGPAYRKVFYANIQSCIIVQAKAGRNDPPASIGY